MLIDNRLNINNIYSQIITDDVFFNARPKSEIFPFNFRQDWNLFYMANSPIVFAHFFVFCVCINLKIMTVEVRGEYLQTYTKIVENTAL